MDIVKNCLQYPCKFVSKETLDKHVNNYHRQEISEMRKLNIVSYYSSERFKRNVQCKCDECQYKNAMVLIVSSDVRRGRSKSKKLDARNHFGVPTGECDDYDMPASVDMYCF